MKAIPQKPDVPGEQTPGNTTAGMELAGVLPARDGLQPITDLNAFLASLPDFGADAARLREAIRCWLSINPTSSMRRFA
jgi:hypothetical protein